MSCIMSSAKKFLKENYENAGVGFAVTAAGTAAVGLYTGRSLSLPLAKEAAKVGLKAILATVSHASYLKLGKFCASALKDDTKDTATKDTATKVIRFFSPIFSVGTVFLLSKKFSILTSTLMKTSIMYSLPLMIIGSLALNMEKNEASKKTPAFKFPIIDSEPSYVPNLRKACAFLFAI